MPEQSINFSPHEDASYFGHWELPIEFRTAWKAISKKSAESKCRGLQQLLKLLGSPEDQRLTSASHGLPLLKNDEARCLVRSWIPHFIELLDDENPSIRSIAINITTKMIHGYKSLITREMFLRLFPPFYFSLFDTAATSDPCSRNPQEILAKFFTSSNHPKMLKILLPSMVEYLKYGFHNYARTEDHRLRSLIHGMLPLMKKKELRKGLDPVFDFAGDILNDATNGDHEQMAKKHRFLLDLASILFLYVLMPSSPRWPDVSGFVVQCLLSSKDYVHAAALCVLIRALRLPNAPAQYALLDLEATAFQDTSWFPNRELILLNIVALASIRDVLVSTFSRPSLSADSMLLFDAFFHDAHQSENLVPIKNAVHRTVFGEIEKFSTLQHLQIVADLSIFMTTESRAKGNLSRIFSLFPKSQNALVQHILDRLGATITPRLITLPPPLITLDDLRTVVNREQLIAVIFKMLHEGQTISMQDTMATCRSVLPVSPKRGWSISRVLQHLLDDLDRIMPSISEAPIEDALFGAFLESHAQRYSAPDLCSLMERLIVRMRTCENNSGQRGRFRMILRLLSIDPHQTAVNELIKIVTQSDMALVAWVQAMAAYNPNDAIMSPRIWASGDWAIPILRWIEEIPSDEPSVTESEPSEHPLATFAKLPFFSDLFDPFPCGIRCRLDAIFGRDTKTGAASAADPPFHRALQIVVALRQIFPVEYQVILFRQITAAIAATDPAPDPAVPALLLELASDLVAHLDDPTRWTLCMDDLLAVVDESAAAATFLAKIFDLVAPSDVYPEIVSRWTEVLVAQLDQASFIPWHRCNGHRVAAGSAQTIPWDRRMAFAHALAWPDSDTKDTLIHFLATLSLLAQMGFIEGSRELAAHASSPDQATSADFKPTARLDHLLAALSAHEGPPRLHARISPNDPLLASCLFYMLTHARHLASPIFSDADYRRHFHNCPVAMSRLLILGRAFPLTVFSAGTRCAMTANWIRQIKRAAHPTEVLGLLAMAPIAMATIRSRSWVAPSNRALLRRLTPSSPNQLLLSFFDRLHTLAASRANNPLYTLAFLRGIAWHGHSFARTARSTRWRAWVARLFWAGFRNQDDQACAAVRYWAARALAILDTNARNARSFFEAEGRNIDVAELRFITHRGTHRGNGGDAVVDSQAEDAPPPDDPSDATIECPPLDLVGEDVVDVSLEVLSRSLDSTLPPFDLAPFEDDGRCVSPIVWNVVSTTEDGVQVVSGCAADKAQANPLEAPRALLLHAISTWDHNALGLPNPWLRFLALAQVLVTLNREGRHAESWDEALLIATAAISATKTAPVAVQAAIFSFLKDAFPEADDPKRPEARSDLVDLLWSIVVSESREETPLEMAPGVAPSPSIGRWFQMDEIASWAVFPALPMISQWQTFGEYLAYAVFCIYATSFSSSEKTTVIADDMEHISEVSMFLFNASIGPLLRRDLDLDTNYSPVVGAAVDPVHATTAIRAAFWRSALCFLVNPLKTWLSTITPSARSEIYKCLFNQKTSTLVLQTAFQTLHAESAAFPDKASIQTRAAARTLIATYKFDDVPIVLDIEFPMDYPVHPPEVALFPASFKNNAFYNQALFLVRHALYRDCKLSSVLCDWFLRLEKRLRSIEACPICLDVFDLNGTGLEPTFRCAQCKHLFHVRCLSDWVKKSREDQLDLFIIGVEKPTCPLCRAEVRFKKLQNEQAKDFRRRPKFKRSEGAAERRSGGRHLL